MKYQSLNLGPKLPHLGFLSWHLKKKKMLSHLKQLPNFQNAKSREKLKILNFWDKMRHLGIFGLEF